MTLVHLGAGGVGIGVQIHPVGLAAQGVGGGGDGHRDAVVAEAHADIAHDDALFGVEGDIPRAFIDADIQHAERVKETGVFHNLDAVIRAAVVAEFFGKFLFGLGGFFLRLFGDGVAEDFFGSVNHNKRVTSLSVCQRRQPGIGISSDVRLFPHNITNFI